MSGCITQVFDFFVNPQAAIISALIHVNSLKSKTRDERINVKCRRGPSLRIEGFLNYAGSLEIRCELS